MTDLIHSMWAYKYEPKTLDEYVASEALERFARKYVEENNLPNLLLVGGPGIGKTTLAKILVNAVGGEYLVINASMHGNIDTLRNEIKQFASTISFSGGKKYVILDEADHLNPQSTQPALRNFIDTYSKNCGFIFTANYENKLIEPLRGGERLLVEHFQMKAAEKPQLALKFFNRVKMILETEGVEYDKKAVAQYIINKAPAWRSIINKLQAYATSHGKIDAGILNEYGTLDLGELIVGLQQKNTTAIREWVSENTSSDISAIYTNIASQVLPFVLPISHPEFIIAIAKYQYQSAFVADQEINLTACMLEIMLTCQFLAAAK